MTTTLENLYREREALLAQLRESSQGMILERSLVEIPGWETEIQSAKSVTELTRAFNLIFDSMESLIPGTVNGEQSTTWLSDDTPVDFRYIVVDVNGLITSHTDEMYVNKNFPQSVQPRARDRAGMQIQIAEMSKKLNPERLAASPSASMGAPIVDQNGIVESGNGRTMAIRRAYKSGIESAKQYRGWIIKNAEKFGIKPEKIEKIKNPVLARLRQTKLDADEFGRKANQAEIAGMSPVEQARADAEMIDDDDMTLFMPAEDGYLGGKDNKAFVQRFLEKLGTAESAGLITAEGNFTRQLLDRLQSAIFQKTYGDEQLLVMIAEEANPSIRNILTALTVSAAEFSRAKKFDPKLGGLNIPSHAVAAAKLIKRSREEGTSLRTLTSQLGFNLEGAEIGDTGAEIPEETIKLAEFIDGNIRSAKRMGTVFKNAAKKIRTYLQDQQQDSLFADLAETELTPSEVIDLAIQRMEESNQKPKDNNQPGLFESADSETIDEKRERRRQVIVRILKEAMEKANQAPGAEPDLEWPEEDAVLESAGGGKEPWEMTREEFLENFIMPYDPAGFPGLKGKTFNQIVNLGIKPGAKKELIKRMDGFRADEISDALRKGKPVPPKVLADYSDLAESFGRKTWESDIQSAKTMKDLWKAFFSAIADKAISGEWVDLPVSSYDVARKDPVKESQKAIDALKKIGGSMVANRIVKSYEKGDPAPLLGQTIKNKEDLAVLAQVYRNPCFETFRVFLINKSGKVVYQSGVTSRKPGSTKIKPSGVADNVFVEKLNGIAKSVNATGFYLMHNHPSGNMEASFQDGMVSRHFANFLKIKFLGHVIVNNKEFAFISENYDESVHPIDAAHGYDLEKDEPELPHPFLGEKVEPETIVRQQKEIEKGGSFQIIGRTSKGEIGGICDIPDSFFRKKDIEKKLIETVQSFSLGTGTTQMIAVNVPTGLGTEKFLRINQRNNLFVDIVTKNGEAYREKNRWAFLAPSDKDAGKESEGLMVEDFIAEDASGNWTGNKEADDSWIQDIQTAQTFQEIEQIFFSALGMPPGKDSTNATATGDNLERHSQDGEPADGMGAGNVQPDGSTDDGDTGGSGQGVDEERAPEQSDNGLPDGSAPVDRAERNNRFHSEDGSIRPEIEPAGTDDGGGSGRTDGEGIQPVTGSEAEIERNDYESSIAEITLEEKIELQKAANEIPVRFNDPNNIRESLPLLFDEQKDDVVKAEQRFFGENAGKGMMFTNGTGSGKTFTALGIVARFWNSGKKNILIVVPQEQKSNDWAEDAAKLSLTGNILKDTQDAGAGITITTYANFTQNEAIKRRDWDLIVYDESHKLNQGQGWGGTSAQEKHKHLAAAPSRAIARARDFHPDQPALEKRIKADVDVQMAEFMGEKQEYFDTLRNNAKATEDPERIDQAEKEIKEAIDAARIKIENSVRHETPEYRDEQNRIDESDFTREKVENLKKGVKVVFLSATPFAYHESLIYADGFLFDIAENGPENDNGDGYNEPGQAESFYVQNFGYRMRYNKLTKPDAEVDISLMERQFHENMKKSGALSSRRLKIDKDYSRHFIKLKPGLGQKIDDGVSILLGLEDREKNKFERLPAIFSQKFKYAYRAQLFEAIKAKESIPRLKKHLSMGRKVIVFHSYVNSLPSNPFDFSEFMGGADEELIKEIEHFNDNYPEYKNLDLRGLADPGTILKKAFGGRAVKFNGTIRKNDKRAAVVRFNEDDSGIDMFIVQIQAGKEGISLHDTTGDKQRVVYMLGLPVAPTDAIQSEGRAYRMGNKSNAIFEYPVLHTWLEKNTFAMKVSERASTAENLGMGEVARNLKSAFKEGYKYATDEEPNENQGTGGQDDDKQLDVIDEFERAKTFYFARMKKTSGNKAAEGKDYFATPEPLGAKLVEWAGASLGESMLEPSGGHGAIGRFFPSFTNNTYVEQSPKLATEMSLNVDDPKGVKNMSFEDLDVGGNKYDCVCMNPPFGTSGKTAIEHLVKATKHLRNGGRIVAILPEGPAMDKRLEKFYDSKDAIGIYIAAEISLPSCTFERAGTKVKTRILILDKQLDSNDAPQMVRRDIGANNISEFFDAVKTVSIPPRKKPSGENTISAQIREKETADILEAAKKYLDFKKISGDSTISLSEMSAEIAKQADAGPGVTREVLKKAYRCELDKDINWVLFNKPPQPKTESEPGKTREEIEKEIIEDEAEKDPNFKKIPDDIVDDFKKIGIVVRFNTKAGYLGFSGKDTAVEPYQRIGFHQPWGQGKHLYNGKDWLKRSYSAKFHNDKNGKTEFKEAWWHIDAKYLDDLEKIYNYLS